MIGWGEEGGRCELVRLTLTAGNRSSLCTRCRGETTDGESMKLLAVDPSLTGTGFAVFDGLSLVCKGTIGTGGPRANRIARVSVIAEYVEDLSKGVDCAVVEGYAYGKQFRGEVLGEVGGAVRIVLWRNAPVLELSPQFWKRAVGLVAPAKTKAFGGKLVVGKSVGKVMYLEYAYKLSGKKFVTTDEADAYLMGMFSARAFCILDGDRINCGGVQERHLKEFKKQWDTVKAAWDEKPK